MTRDDLLQAFGELGRYVAERNRVIDLAIYGGSTLMLVSNFRVSSGDVYAVAQTDQRFVDEAARAVAGRLDLPDDWLDDGVRTYLSPTVDHPDHHLFFRSFPSERHVGIRIYVPTAEYMLAMKLMSLRIGPDDSKDLADILSLCRVTGIDTATAMINLASAFYPEARVSGKLRLSVDHIARSASQPSDDTAPRYLGQSGRASK